MKKILIMGLPGSGKTTLARELLKLLPYANWLNGDEVRKQFYDWDFTPEGRLRQAQRMYDLSQTDHNYTIIDFVCPLPVMRDIVKPDYIVWIDTIDRGRFEDTNKMFIPPSLYDFRINTQDCVKWSKFISEYVINDKKRPVFDWKKETVQMLGRWQPWHEGHRALFERALAKTGQVVIQIRDCQGWQESNPFEIEQVKNFIKKDLDPLYQGQYEIQIVPNIVNITYGRDVGYKIEQEVFTEEIHNISATKIRKELGI